jgi:hypothetical protein
MEMAWEKDTGEVLINVDGRVKPAPFETGTFF